MTGNDSSLLDGCSIAIVALLVAAACLLWLTPRSTARLSAIAFRDGQKGDGGRRDGEERAGQQLRVRAVAGVSAAAALWALAGTLLTATVLAGIAIGVAVARRAKFRRDEEDLRQAVYELCRAIAAELRAGGTPAAAFRTAVTASPDPLQGELRRAAQFVGQAEPAEFADLLIDLGAARRALAGLARLAACWQVVVASGAMLAPAIDRVAEALRDEIDLDQALTASLAAPRATVRLLAGLPLLGLGLGAVIGARPLAFLVGSPAGICCLLLAAAFDASGVAWARRIANRAAGSRDREAPVIGARTAGSRLTG